MSTARVNSQVNTAIRVSKMAKDNQPTIANGTKVALRTAESQIDILRKCRIISRGIQWPLGGSGC